jgi:hypothetical protein
MGARRSLQPYLVRQRLRSLRFGCHFAECRQVLSEEAAIKVVLGAELSLHAGYTLEALQRVAAWPKRSTRFRQYSFLALDKHC